MDQVTLPAAPTEQVTLPPDAVPTPPPVAPLRLHPALGLLLRTGRRGLTQLGLTLTPLAPGAGRLARLHPRRLRWGVGPGLAPDSVSRAQARLRGFRAFRPEDYRLLNPDVVTRDAARHALRFGWLEGRRLFRPETLAQVLGELRRAPAHAEPIHAAPLAAVAEAPVGICCSSLGNVFIGEIADDLAAVLAARGVPVRRLDETADPATRPGRCIIVAPHEFFLLGRGSEWRRDAVIANAVMLNTEQVQTDWFTTALPFLLAARGVIDLCAQMRDLFEECGLPSHHLTMAPPHATALTSADRRHPLVRVLPAAAREEPDIARLPEARPIEVAFFGAASPHREALLARHAAFLADYRCFIYCRRADVPITAAGAEGALSRIARHVGGHAGITLNLHRDAFGYFEWHRIVRLGLCTGSVVVSEPCLPHPDFRPGEHYFEEAGRQIPNLVEWLLRNEDGRAAARRVQANARALLDSRFATAAVADGVLRFLERVA